MTTMTPFRVFIGGIAIEASTPQDAIALALASREHVGTGQQNSRQRDDSTLKQARPSSPSAPRDAWRTFVSRLNQSQIQVLETIKNNPNGLTAPQIGKLLDRATNSITGSIGGGLYKNIPKAGLDTQEVLRVSMIRGEKHYLPGPLLLALEIPPVE